MSTPIDPAAVEARLEKQLYTGRDDTDWLIATCRYLLAELAQARGAPAPDPTPGKSRGAEVAEKMIETFVANVRWICTKAIDAERAAARRAALDEAEAAVLSYGALNDTPNPSIRDAAVAVAKLKETP